MMGLSKQLKNQLKQFGTINKRYKYDKQFTGVKHNYNYLH